MQKTDAHRNSNPQREPVWGQNSLAVYGSLMDCESPEELIACAIRASSQLGIFDYFAFLIVPMFLGLVTLAVAVASWRTARASHELSVAIVAERERGERDARKLALADRAFQWSAERWTDTIPDVKEKARRAAEFGRLSVALTESGLPGAGVLQSFLWDLDHATQPNNLKSDHHTEIANSYIGGSFSAATERAIIEWLHRPEELSAFVEPLRSGIPGVLKDARRRAKKSMREIMKSYGRSAIPPEPS